MTINGSPGNCWLDYITTYNECNSPTNSPYLTGKTSSFHGNRTEQEKEKNRQREMERQRREDGCWGCGEKRAYRNRKMKNMSIVLFVWHGANVTLDGGEMEGG